jgi:hypothetical protein
LWEYLFWTWRQALHSVVMGERLRIGAGVDAATLRTVLEALRA